MSDMWRTGGDPNMHRFHVTFPNPEEMGMGGESMFGERVGDGPDPQTGLYKINNIPFFADLRMDDVVVCDESDPDLIPEFVRVHEQSSTPTAQVIFEDDLSEDDMRTVMTTLKKLGCKTERARERFWVLALPAEKEQRELVLDVLDGGGASGVLQYEYHADQD